MGLAQLCRHHTKMRLPNSFFAIINLEMSVQGKKRDWFDLGAKAYSQACPGIYAAPTYVCPICRKPFTVEALDDGVGFRRSTVPPQSVGGHEQLLLTCTRSTTTRREPSWTPMQRRKEDVRLAMTGRPGPEPPHRIKATIGGIIVNGQLHAKNGLILAHDPQASQ